jgi:hypothetical protein
MGITPEIAAEGIIGYDQDDFPMTVGEALLCR